MSRHKQVLAPTRHWRLLSRHNVNTLVWSRSCLSVCVHWQYSWPCLLLTTQRNQGHNNHSDTNTVHWLHNSWLVRPGDVNQDDVCRTCNVMYSNNLSWYANIIASESDFVSIDWVRGKQMLWRCLTAHRSWHWSKDPASREHRQAWMWFEMRLWRRSYFFTLTIGSIIVDSIQHEIIKMHDYCMISNWSQIESDCMKRLRSFVVYISFSFSWTQVYQEKA